MLTKSNMQIQIKLIEHGSPLFAEEVQLRYEILRKPLNLNYTPEQLAEEHDQIHFGAYSQDTLLACMLLKHVSDDVAQLRQAATAGHVQGKGIGSMLLLYIEAYAQAHGYKEIILHARETAIPFYQKAGYQIISEEYIEVGLPHKSMKKTLLPV